MTNNPLAFGTDVMKEYKLENPHIETDENWFTITFKMSDMQKESYEQRFYGKGSTLKSALKKYTENINSTQKIIVELKYHP